MMKKLTAVLLLTAMTAGLAACGSNKGADTNTDAPAQNESTEETVTTETSGAAQNADIQGTITLAAAASLEKSFTEHLIPMFEEQYPEVSIEGTYESSGKLQSQIEAGADVDIFFSAALKQMEALQEEGYIAEDDIVHADMIAIGDSESVPAGQYGKEALENLDLWSSVEGKLSLGTNVTEVLNWVAEGSADAGIVYATDAASMTDKVSVVAEAPEGSVSKVIYPVAELKETKNKDAADAFMEFLQSGEALDVFKAAGFSVNAQE